MRSSHTGGSGIQLSHQNRYSRCFSAASEDKNTLMGLQGLTGRETRAETRVGRHRNGEMTLKPKDLLEGEKNSAVKALESDHQCVNTASPTC